MFGFVVLHYLVDDATAQCVDSILEYCGGESCRIVIVDNDSANGSFERLQARYAETPGVTLLHNAANEGFARGPRHPASRCCTTPRTRVSRAATTLATGIARASCTATIL